MMGGTTPEARMAGIEFKTGEIETSLSIMREVADWCRKTGRFMWPEEILNRETLNDPAEDFVVAYMDGEPAATMILSWEDARVWPGSARGEAGYIHKLAVRRKFAGRDLSGELFRWAREACRARGAKWLRLDTGSKRYRLHALYEKSGFRLIEVKKIDWYVCHKYEMDA
jgi:GNAT superfamily N-acetyltransferase